ncbi:MAG: helix-turn-helix transcriptional regulator [Clostridia bacterium]|nr:helix-turn-helix transcriptional regulator [Clostridia bacterium]
MSVTYKKLWKMLIDNNMKKKDLQQAANLTSYAMHKLSKDDTVTTEILEKICIALNCTVDDIMEFSSENKF